MPSLEASAAIAGGASTAALLYWQARTYATPPLQPVVPGPIGWKGPVEERPRVHQPVFEDSESGRQAFVAFLRNALQNIGLTHRQALLFIAHKARESGWGKAVWNFNFGNIKTGSQIRGPWFWLTDKRGPDKYRAYDTAEDGIWDNVELIRKLSRYKKAWAMLIAEDPNWYGELGLSGYYGDGAYTHARPGSVAVVQAEYNDILDGVVRRDQAQPEAPRPYPVGPILASSLDLSELWRIAWISTLVGIGTYAAVSIATIHESSQTGNGAAENPKKRLTNLQRVAEYIEGSTQWERGGGLAWEGVMSVRRLSDLAGLTPEQTERVIVQQNEALRKELGLSSARIVEENGSRNLKYYRTVKNAWE